MLKLTTFYGGLLTAGDRIAASDRSSDAGRRRSEPPRMPWKARAVLALVAAAILATGTPARADDGPVSSSATGWSFQLSPYLWMTGLNGDVGTRPRLPTVDVDAGFDEIFEHLDFAFMAVAEARHGRVGALVDVAYLPLSADGTTPGAHFGDVDVDNTTFFGTFSLGYRAFDDPAGTVDVLAGVRAWSVDNDVTFTAGLLPQVETGVSESWVDPVVGLRGQVDLGSRFFASAYGDIGGFGVVSDLTWQVYGGVGYRFSDFIAGQIGYRHLSVDYEDDGFVWDVELSGPTVGLSIRF
ncbi:hypothetical protein [Inquilinus sp. CAU 1745]|uniref:hypothetical protein n=1 Tax=Inquilinus sp. CAU 1745 TaxID=3140369 RepID=UPI00325B2135